MELFEDLLSNINGVCFTILKWNEYSFYWKRNLRYEEKWWLGWEGSRGESCKGIGHHGPLEQGKKICSSFKSNEVIKIKSNRKSRNKSKKFLEKESSKIQGVTCANSRGEKKAMHGTEEARKIWVVEVSTIEYSH